MRHFVLICIVLSSASGQLYPPSGFFSTSDLTSVTFAHGVNSQKSLTETLANPSIRMIEADVCKGRVRFNGSETPYDIAIMADPPLIISDLSFQQFLDTIIDYNRYQPVEQRKGVKLDFKDYFGVVAAVSLMRQRNVTSNGTDLQFPVWLNAQVVVRPEEPTTIDPEDSTTDATTEDDISTESPTTTTPRPNDVMTVDQMITLHAKQLPNAVLSLWFPTRPGQTNYTRQDVLEMITALQNEIPDPLALEELPITFTLNADLAARSLGSVMYLLNATSVRATVTLSAEERDSPASSVMINDFLKVVGKHKAFVDVPFDFRDSSAANVAFNFAFVLLSCSIRYFCALLCS